MNILRIKATAIQSEWNRFVFVIAVTATYIIIIVVINLIAEFILSLFCFFYSLFLQRSLSSSGTLSQRVIRSLAKFHFPILLFEQTFADRLRFVISPDTSYAHSVDQIDSNHKLYVFGLVGLCTVY